MVITLFATVPDIACQNIGLPANPKPTNNIGTGGAVLPVSLETD
jgi:hypothetical protein